VTTEALEEPRQVEAVARSLGAPELAVLDDLPGDLPDRAGDPTLDDLLDREQPSPAARRARGA
jgi:DNA recombination protein RmuC